jgi:hypothetical protein
MQLLETMKYPDVKGYVWYVDMNMIEAVKIFIPPPFIPDKV